MITENHSMLTVSSPTPFPRNFEVLIVTGIVAVIDTTDLLRAEFVEIVEDIIWTIPSMQGKQVMLITPAYTPLLALTVQSISVKATGYPALPKKMSPPYKATLFCIVVLMIVISYILAGSSISAMPT